MALPLAAVGSLGPRFRPDRLVSLTVKLPYALALAARFPTVLREPLGASVTIWEATAPVKLPTCHCPENRSGPRLGLNLAKGGIPRLAPPRPEPRLLSLPPILCDLFGLPLYAVTLRRHPFSRGYGVILPSSLTRVLSRALALFVPGHLCRFAVRAPCTLATRFFLSVWAEPLRLCLRSGSYSRLGVEWRSGFPWTSRLPA